MKRIIYLSTIIGVIAAVVGVFYFLRYRTEKPAGPEEAPAGGLPAAGSQARQQPTATAPTGGETTAGAPQGAQAEVVQPGQQKFGVIAHNEVLSYFVDGQNSAIIVQPDGQIVKIARGEASALSSSLISGLMSAEFSYDGKRVLAAFGSRSDPQYSIFDIEAKSWKPLPSGIRSAAWSPTDYGVAYFGSKNGATSLMTLDTGSEKAAPQEIMKLKIEDASIFWPFPKLLFLADKPSVFYQGSLLGVDIAKKTLALFAGPRPGLISAWSREAGLGLVFGGDQSRRGGRLSLLDAAGNALNDLAFLTMPSKCAFSAQNSAATSTSESEKFLYCAIPINQEEFRAKTLPDDYLKRAFYAQDKFYKINLANGDIKEIFGGSVVDGDSLKVFGKNLFFLNRLDKKLYAISLE